MPALSGGVVQTLYDANSAPVFVISTWYVEATGALRDVATTTSRGTLTGAIVVDNLTGKPQQISARNEATGQANVWTIPRNGVALTVAQLAAQNPPVANMADLAGMTPTIT